MKSGGAGRDTGLWSWLLPNRSVVSGGRGQVKTLLARWRYPEHPHLIWIFEGNEAQRIVGIITP